MVEWHDSSMAGKQRMQSSNKDGGDHIPWMPDWLWDNCHDGSRFSTQKGQKRLRNWANRLLTWDGQVMLLWHVLRAIPSYHLMFAITQQTRVQGIRERMQEISMGDKPRRESKESHECMGGDNPYQSRRRSGDQTIQGASTSDEAPLCYTTA